MACILLLSAMALPASAANTTDTQYLYEWSDSTSRYDYTPERVKQDDSPIYIKTVYETLPHGGYYAMAMYKMTPTEAVTRYQASRGEYLINDYAAYIINTDNVSQNLTGKFALIRGHYKNTTYTWGDCTILWSPDTANASAYPSLN